MRMGRQAPAMPKQTIRADVALLEPLLIQLLKLAAMISRPMEDGVASPNGLTLNELRILMCLRGEGACAGHDITSLMAIPPMNVSRAIASLVQRGWIEPALDPGNRRRRPVRLSATGEQACAAMERNIDAVAGYLLGMLDTGEAKALHRHIDAVIGRLEDWPAAHPAAE